MRSAFDPSAVRSGAVFSDNPNYEIAYLCYINGVETPILGFNITSGVWQPAQFEIHVAPDVMLLGLGREDRVPVALFYLDHWNNPERPEFRLLVDGEIKGYRSRRANGTRMLSFSCGSFISVFEKLYFFFMNTVDDIVAAQSPEVRTQGFTGQGLFYPYSLFHQGLFVNQGTGANAEVQLDTQDAPADGATPTAPAADGTTPTPGQGDMVKTAHEIHYNVIKGIIASAPTVPDDKRSLPMMNFFARHTRKTRLHHRFVRLPLLEDVDAVQARKGVFPIFAAVRADEALTAMQHQVAGQIGNSGTIWDMLKQIYGLVYMEMTAIPNPAAVRTNMEGEILGPVSQGDTLIEQRPNMSPPTALSGAGPTSVTTSTTIGSSPATPIRLAQYFAKPQSPYGIPPHCNVVLPSMLEDLTYGEEYSDQPTRIYVNDSVMSRVLRGSGPNREFMLHALTVAFPEEADGVMHATVPNGETQTGELHATGKNLLIWPEEFYKGPVTAKMELPSWFQTMMQFLNANSDTGAGTSAVNGAGPPAPTVASSVAPSSSSPAAGGGVASSSAATSSSATAGAPTSSTAATIPTRTSVAASTAGPVRPIIARPPTPHVFIPGGRRFPGRSYRNAIPSVWAAGWGPLMAQRWNGEIGQMVATMVPIIFGPNTPPELFLGFSISANPTDNTTDAVRGQRFHELGLFGVEGGLRNTPAPNPVVGAPYSNWAACASAPEVRRAIGAVEGRQRNATLEPGGWRALPDQIAVGLQNLKEHRHDVVNILNARGVRSAEDNSQWSLIMMMAAWSAGPTGAANMATNPAIRAAVTAAPVASRWETVVRAMYEAGVAGTLLPGPARSHRNRFYTLVRTLQKFEAGRLLAHRTGNGAWYDDHLGEARETIHDRLAYLAYVPQPAQVPLRGRDDPNAAGDERRDRDDVLEVSSEPVREVVDAVAQREVTREETRVVTGEETPPGAVAMGGTAERGEADRTPTTTVTTASTAPATGGATTPIASDTAELPPNEKFAELFRIYAQAELMRRRYAQNNGATQLKFNPYVVAGFPCIVFDRASNSEHVVGYVYTVNHAAMGNSISTSMTLTHVRTLPEMLNDVRNDCERFSERVIAAPAEMIPEVRRVFQQEDNAEVFYQRLFYGGARPGNLPAAFHFDRALGYTRGLNVEAISITSTRTETPETAPAETTTPDGAPEVRVRVTSRVTHNLDPNEALTPLPNTIYADAFDNHHLAMQLAARNVCTLTEYIRFWHGGRTVGDLMRTNEVEGIESDFAYGTLIEPDVAAQSNRANGQQTLRVTNSERYSAVYYRRIYKLRPGPGSPPSEQERGYNSDGTPSSGTAGVSGNYPQTRANWDVVLLAYRSKIRSRVSPST